MTRAPQHYFVDEVVDRDVARALDRLAATDDVVHVAVMPDVHLAEDVCVGCVAATTQTLYPEAVGGDLGCGMAAVRFDAPGGLDRSRAAALLVRLSDIVPANRHPTQDAHLPDELDRALSAPALDKLRRGIARVQFATLGRGNHFVELQRAEDDGALWLMLHSGSRGIGQAIRDHHVARTGDGPGLRGIAADSADGRAYLDDLAWALAYAAASRRRMAERVADAIAELVGAAADWSTYRDVHHNHVRREDHGGRALWVHRKGAIAAALDEPGVIPGSMGSASYHVRGRGEPTSLCSSSHGAGRAMSRGEARRRITATALVAQASGVYFDHRLAHDLRDEAPAAYKDIGRVMRAQKALTRIERTLHPVLCFKAT